MNDLSARYLAAKRKLFEGYYAKKLNPEQCRAVLTVKGPLLILAGAGSGKTTVLVNRICHIIKYGLAYESEKTPTALTEEEVRALEQAADADLSQEEVCDILNEFSYEACPPWGMLAITFTNKAAKEIRERLDAAFGDPEVSSAVWAGTFHSICVRILRKYGERVGLKSGFSIYDTADQKHVVSAVMKELNIDEKVLPIRSVMSEISSAKNELKTPTEYFPGGSDFRRRQISDIYTAYQKKLAECNAVDFDDIIMKTVELLQDNEDVATYYQNKFHYVCVDEYQDTNPAQFKLTYLLSAGRRNIMVVGDDDQSIYRFRGATVENILHFDTAYPDATVIKLEQNYRSTKTILAAANSVIAHNTDRHDKALWSAKEEGEKITVHRAHNEEGECRYIIDTILSRVVKEKKTYRDFAILYRVNAISRSLETALAKSGIPYRMLGGLRFYDRKEIKDILAYLYLIQNPSDNQRLLRIVNEPKRKIGEKTMETVAALAAETGGSLYDVMQYATAFPPLAKVADKLVAFADMIAELRALQLPPSALIPQVMEKTGYLAMLKAGGLAMQDDIDNLNELISAAMTYEEKQPEPILYGFLEEAALVSDVDQYNEQTNAVVLMTIHSAKGLEFPVVFLAGAEEGVFPGVQSVKDPTELPEERRLAYVAITRAKEKLYVTYAAERLLYGMTQHGDLSRFIGREITPTLLESDTPKPVHTAPPPKKKQTVSAEFSHRASIVGAPGGQKQLKNGFIPMQIGDRVRHPSFGEGEVLSVRSMGADELYEVRFDTGEVKKLMATFAKLQKV